MLIHKFRSVTTFRGLLHGLVFEPASGTIKWVLKSTASLKALEAEEWSRFTVTCNASPEALRATCGDVCPYRQLELVSFMEATTKHVTRPEGTCGSR